MINSRIYNVISRVLLVYFAIFIVPPVSTLASPGVMASTAGETILVPDRQRAPLLLFDIVLWQQLKKAKHADEVLASGGVRLIAKQFESSDQAALIRFCTPFPDILHFIGDAFNVHRLRSSGTRFSVSGTSPPFFS